MVSLDDFEQWLNNKSPEFRDDFMFELNNAFEMELRRPVTLDDILNDLPDDISTVIMIIGENNDKFVSFVRCIYIPDKNSFLSNYRISSDYKQYKYILLSSLFVSTKFRNLGHGQLLIKKTRELLCKKTPNSDKYWILLQVFKHNLSALLCYLKAGFEFVDFTVKDYLMSIKLDKIDTLEK
jgi:ribosomal protein S18 acetylase RimI-like enzyme